MAELNNNGQIRSCTVIWRTYRGPAPSLQKQGCPFKSDMRTQTKPQFTFSSEEVENGRLSFFSFQDKPRLSLKSTVPNQLDAFSLLESQYPPTRQRTKLTKSCRLIANSMNSQYNRIFVRNTDLKMTFHAGMFSSSTKIMNAMPQASLNTRTSESYPTHNIQPCLTMACTRNTAQSVYEWKPLQPCSVMPVVSQQKTCPLPS